MTVPEQDSTPAQPKQSGKKWTPAQWLVIIEVINSLWSMWSASNRLSDAPGASAVQITQVYSETTASLLLVLCLLLAALLWTISELAVTLAHKNDHTS